MATEVTEKDLDKVRSENEKIAEQIAEEERKLSEARAQQDLSNTKVQLDSENDRLKAKLAELKEQVKAQKAVESVVPTFEEQYKEVVSVEGDTPVAAAPEVLTEQKKEGN